MHTRHPVVLFLRQRGIRITHTRSHQLCHAALNQFLRQLGILQLVADGYAKTRTNELGQIGVQRMKRETRHLQCLRSTACSIAAVGERDIQYLARLHGILRIRLVEITATKQQHRIRILCLDVTELFHHRCKFFCHIFKLSTFNFKL